ncbi:hypothetical protein [Streptomyces iconiensis]|uniref:Secreted protein n=1 Tax=Streptomyces iconiensis TaxID=1384038 RepID=A0ABT6ZVK1_9ACTN|nr:hypothetical protein [Streptomyces iconiensis]MDJ1132852.1 hypothetical protein [Streptomyces iconiensis]
MRRSLAAAVTTTALALAVAPVGAAHAKGSDSGATPTGKILGEASKSAVESATPQLPTDKLVNDNMPARR